MLGPGLKPRERRAYDRTQSWASNYYKGWAARIQAEREARQLAGTIPDELMNEFSDSDDEKAIQITRHVPTPQSMPSSPIMASIPKPIDSGVPYKSSFIETQSACYDGGCSPIDIDTQPLDSASWQRSSQRSDHQSLKRFPSDLSDSNRKSSVKTRSRSAGSTKFFNLAAGSKKASAATKHSRRSSSSRTNSSMMYPSNDGGAVHQVRRGRVAKRRSYHRGPI